MNLNRVKDEEEYTEYWYFELSCSLETQGAFLYLFWLFWKRPEGFGSFISLLRWGRRGHETLSSSKEDSNESEEKSSHVHREAHVQRCPQTSRDWWLCWCSSGWMFALHTGNRVAHSHPRHRVSLQFPYLCQCPIRMPLTRKRQHWSVFPADKYGRFSNNNTYRSEQQSATAHAGPLRTSSDLSVCFIWNHLFVRTCSSSDLFRFFWKRLCRRARRDKETQL